MSQESIKNALGTLQKAFKELTKEERQAVIAIQKECADAKAAGTIEDERLEFCYCVKMSAGSIANEKLIAACDAYIKAAKE